MDCNLCKVSIKVESGEYVHIEDYKKEKVVSDMWCHLKCFKKAMNRELTALEKQAKEMLGRAGGIFESDSFKQMFPNKQKEFNLI
ncbi:hypothetical protein CMI43_03195 [Candidatus Pacearchaeota archaeon]|jgi:hypothetical protein|nr:hypothetical protein [Candidatus Pacearchaeota archaeon]